MIGVVRPMIHLIVKSNRIRKIKASKSPEVLALACRCCGSFPVMIDMKMILSIPKIISIKVNVKRAIIPSNERIDSMKANIETFRYRNVQIYLSFFKVTRLLTNQ